jgi:Ca2+-binding EF-hand superfamily protein
MGNKSGSASSILTTLQKNSLAGKDTEKDLGALWKKYDKDSSGWLENDEAVRFFGEVYDWLNASSSQQTDKQATVADWILSFDANGDGKISWKEFSQAATSAISGSMNQ